MIIVWGTSGLPEVGIDANLACTDVDYVETSTS